MPTALAAAIVRHRVWILVTVGLLTVLFASQIRNLKIVIDPAALLPQQHPNVIGTNLAERLFGSKYVVVVGVSPADGGSALRPEVLETVARLTQALSNVPGVKRHTMMSATADKAKSITGVGDELHVEPMLTLPITSRSGPELAAKLTANPVYQHTLLSADGSVAAISFSVQVTQQGFRDAMDRVQAVLAQHRTPQVRIVASGVPVFYATIEHFAQRMGVLFPLALLLIGLIHFEAFRTVQGLLLPLVTALVAVVWGLGLMGAARVPMDAFNATTPILILAVAAGHAVQILKRYYEEYDRIGAAHPALTPRECNQQAIVASLTKVGPVMLTAGIVAALGFFSLISFDLATIRSFGIFTGLGIVSALIIELSFIPALRSCLPPPPRKLALSLTPTRVRLWDRIARRLADTVIAQRGAILTGFAALAALSLWGMTHIQQENSTKSYFGADLPVRQDDRFLNAKLAGTNTLYLVFQGPAGEAGAGRMKDPALLHLMQRTQRYIETLPEVGKTLSIVDFLRQMNRSMHGGAAAFDSVPDSAEQVAQYLLLYSMSGQPTDFDAYIDDEQRNANLIVWMKNDSSHYAEDILARIRAHLQPQLPPGVTIQIGGSVPQTSALTQTLIRGKALNIAQMMAVVFVAGMLAFRSVLAGLYLIAPLIVTVLVNFGVMGLTGIPLNTPNSVSSAMAIGIGADYAIYLLYRMREECERLGDIDLALRETMRTAGQAVVYVATAIAGGYSVLMLSFGFYVHIWFGILIVLSMVVSAATALVLVPTLLKAFPPGFIQRRLRARTAPSLATATVAPLHRQRLARRVAGAALLALLALLAGLPRLAQAQTPSASEIMERNHQATRLDSSVAEATFRLVSASGQERVRKTTSLTKLRADGLANRRMLRFLSPSDTRNTTTLLLENTGADDEIWIYLPALKKARRLAASNKKSSFVGTDLSYGDMAGHKPADWTHRLLRSETLAGKPCHVVESVPRTPEVAADSGYAKRTSWVTQDAMLALKVEFADAAGAPLKTVESSDWKLVDEARRKWQAMKVKVVQHQTGHSTYIQLERFQANVPVPEEAFTVRYIETEE